MYKTHANEDICDFKRGVCHEPVALTNFFFFDFFTGFVSCLETPFGIQMPELLSWSGAALESRGRVQVWMPKGFTRTEYGH